MNKKFYKSAEMFSKSKKGISQCMWQIQQDNFFLECHNTPEGLIIVQIWPDGKGFTTFKEDNS